ncbi:MAG: hypothetical protein ACHRXM_20210, partial [Isosphaerales bacterium]
MSGLEVVVEHGEAPVLLDGATRQRLNEAKKADGSRREVRLRPGTLFLAVSLGVVLSCCHARGDEPASAQEGVAERSPRFLARIRDRWVRRAQATAQPRSQAPAEGIATPPAASPIQGPTATAASSSLSQELSRTGDESVRRVQASAILSPGAAQPGTAASRPAPSPAQAPSSRTTPTPPSPSPSPAAIPPTPSTTPAQPSTAASTLSQPGLAAAIAEAAACVETAGGFGELSSFGQGRTFQMIGDQAPILALHPLALPPKPPPLPRPGQASSFVASVRGLKISENQSPNPQDRVFYSFNFFAEVNQHLNQKFQSSVDGLRVYREVFGF